jgi:hypothetical protein
LQSSNKESLVVDSPLKADHGDKEAFGTPEGTRREGERTSKKDSLKLKPRLSDNFDLVE